jgi:uncharacterized damage-inducible protein DinB
MDCRPHRTLSNQEQQLKTRILAALLVVALPALPAVAQTANKDILAKHWKTSGEFTAAVAAAMPADGYSFRPVPEEMSFGEVMAHIATADRGACAVASGLTAPAIPAKLSAWLKDPGKVDVDKDTAIQFLNETFAFCGKAIAAMPASRADTVVGTPSRNLTGSEYLWAYFTHTAHHRGQAEVYLRLKGIKPPDYEF